MTLNPFKERKVDFSLPVEVYRCLTKSGKWFSVRQNGLVVAHTNDLTLKHCEAVVNESGKKRCLTSGKRNVHAFIRGYIVQEDFAVPKLNDYLRYEAVSNNGFFVVKQNGTVWDVKTLDLVRFSKDGVFAKIDIEG